VSGYLNTPAAVPLGKECPEPTHRSLGGPKRLWMFWRREMSLVHAGTGPKSSHYTNCAILAPFIAVAVFLM